MTAEHGDILRIQTQKLLPIRSAIAELRQDAPPFIKRAAIAQRETDTRLAWTRLSIASRSDNSPRDFILTDGPIEERAVERYRLFSERYTPAPDDTYPTDTQRVMQTDISEYLEHEDTFNQLQDRAKKQLMAATLATTDPELQDSLRDALARDREKNPLAADIKAVIRDEINQYVRTNSSARHNPHFRLLIARLSRRDFQDIEGVIELIPETNRQEAQFLLGNAVIESLTPIPTHPSPQSSPAPHVSSMAELAALPGTTEPLPEARQATKGSTDGAPTQPGAAGSPEAETETNDSINEIIVKALPAALGEAFGGNMFIYETERGVLPLCVMDVWQGENPDIHIEFRTTDPSNQTVLFVMNAIDCQRLMGLEITSAEQLSDSETQLAKLGEIYEGAEAIARALSENLKASHFPVTLEAEGVSIEEQENSPVTATRPFEKTGYIASLTKIRRAGVSDPFSLVVATENPSYSKTTPAPADQPPHTGVDLEDLATTLRQLPERSALQIPQPEFPPLPPLLPFIVELNSNNQIVVFKVAKNGDAVSNGQVISGVSRGMVDRLAAYDAGLDASLPSGFDEWEQVRQFITLVNGATFIRDHPEETKEMMATIYNSVRDERIESLDREGIDEDDKKEIDTEARAIREPIVDEFWEESTPVDTRRRIALCLQNITYGVGSFQYFGIQDETYGNQEYQDRRNALAFITSTYERNLGASDDTRGGQVVNEILRNEITHALLSTTDYDNADSLIELMQEVLANPRDRKNNYLWYRINSIIVGRMREEEKKEHVQAVPTSPTSEIGTLATSTSETPAIRTEEATRTGQEQEISEEEIPLVRRPDTRSES